MTPATTMREIDDNYVRVIVVFGSHRLIDGACGITWIIQQRDGVRKDGTLRWTGRSYPRRRETVLRLYRTLCDVPDATVVSVLVLLPERHPRWGGKK